MKKLYIKEDYIPKLDLKTTQYAIKFVKDYFQTNLAKELNLLRVSAPLFVRPSSGLNDDLNGIERPVSFDLLNILDKHNKSEVIEIVHSLAKWKRFALNEYNIPLNEGLYTDMNAIRRDEITDALHSIYVDQWDWELHIDEKERNIEFLEFIVRKIYKVIYETSLVTKEKFPNLEGISLPKDIKFVTSQEMEDKYPDVDPDVREKIYARKYGAIFVEKIGYPLNKSNIPHDGRAADYDDWELNGDIIVYNKIIDDSMELSSMGIRVNKDSLIKQLKYKNEEYKLNTPYSKSILNDELPLSIGGGIGQSRLCMLLLEKLHIGEVQSSIWDNDDIKILKRNGIKLL